jgi:predicted metal-dependent HD superfamily phosphohydrolase
LGEGRGVSLTAHWSMAWSLLGAGPPADEVFDDLVARYREPHRAYHTLQHLEECFASFDDGMTLAERPGEVLVGLWFHDAVYDTHASDNEAASARLAEAVLQNVGAASDQTRRVAGLVLATRHETAPLAGDQALIVDIDLAILGAPAARFDEYEDQIRREYAWVPGPLFDRNRARILRQFLERPAIYTTAHFGARFEARARANIRRSLTRLTG